MSTERLVFSLLFLEDPQLLQSFPRQCRLSQLTLSFTILAMLIEDLQEVFRDELGWVKLLVLRISCFLECPRILGCGTLGKKTVF